MTSKGRIGWVGTTIDRASMERFDALADRLGMTRAALMRLAIRRYEPDPSIMSNLAVLRDAKRAAGGSDEAT